MEQTVQSKHVRPKVEEVSYSPQIQAKRHITFGLAVIEEHHPRLSDMDLEEIEKLSKKVVERCEFYLKGRK